MTFSPPAIEPLSRLKVSQGLLITTERWRQAQAYHRQRQNIHYQSLHQPGIVRGLGVSAMAKHPAWSKGEELHYLWVKISPGIAIDIEGNPIILQHSKEFGLNPFILDLTHDSQPTVYLVAQYVDPEGDHEIEFLPEDKASAPDALLQDRVQESCRFVWRRQTQLQPNDVELCRVHLQVDNPHLQSASSVYFPEQNALDFRHRLTVQPRSQAVVKVGHIYEKESDRAIAQSSFFNLVQSTAHLSPAIQGQLSVTDISKEKLKEARSHRQESDPIFEALSECQLTYVRHADLLGVEYHGQARLRDYLHQGGVLLIEADADLPSLEAFQKEIQMALSDLKAIENSEKDEDLINLKARLEGTLAKVNTRIDHNISTLCEQIKSFAEKIGYPLSGEGTIDSSHPLRQAPFTFSAWPTTDKQNPIRLFCWNGIVLALGHLSKQWAPETMQSQSPQENRMAEEWGLNLLNYAWKHHQMTQLQQVSANHE